MEIIKAHYKLSKPVSNYREIRAEAKKMLQFIEEGGYKGFYNKAYAIAHCQVSETPMSFFVVAGECVTNDKKMNWYKMFEDRVIINPKIIEAEANRRLLNPDEKSKDKILTIPNIVEYQEPCMSFPYRKPKRVKRFNFIKVKYQVPRWYGLKTVEAELEGVASEIFQHCYDLTRAKNIYFESETPTKWWELIGKDRPVDKGSSIDRERFNDTGLTPKKERATKI
jgi:peptide deformylase